MIKIAIYVPWDEAGSEVVGKNEMIKANNVTKKPQTAIIVFPKVPPGTL